jgi:hypothetical protein
LFWSFAVALALLPVTLPARAQQQSATEEEPEIAANEKTGADVIIDGRTILTVYQPIGASTPQDRAERIAKRIIAVAQDAAVTPESVGVQPREDWTEISSDSTVFMAVTDLDAKMAGKSRKQLASESAGNIRQALVNYRRDHSWNATFRAIIYTLVATAILVAVGWAFRKVRLAGQSRFAKWIETRKKDTEGKKTAWQVAFNYALSLAIAVGTVIRWLVVIALLQVYATVVLSFYSGSRYISQAINGWILGALTGLGQSALEYIPNLVVIAVVAAVASQVIRLISMIFGEIGKGNPAFPGFYPEWAELTLPVGSNAGAGAGDHHHLSLSAGFQEPCLSVHLDLCWRIALPGLFFGRRQCHRRNHYQVHAVLYCGRLGANRRYGRRGS